MSKVWVMVERAGGGVEVLGAFGSRALAEAAIPQPSNPALSPDLAALADKITAAGGVVNLPGVPKAEPGWVLAHETETEAWWTKGASTILIRECEVQDAGSRPSPGV